VTLKIHKIELYECYMKCMQYCLLSVLWRVHFCLQSAVARALLFTVSCCACDFVYSQLLRVRFCLQSAVARAILFTGMILFLTLCSGACIFVYSQL
jgi:hypothetical protein